MKSRPNHLTLLLATLLHTFTHAYGTMLVPLYLLIRADLRLGGVKAAALIVTVYGVTYSALSYKTGVLADRHDRRMLLGVGLIGNAVAVLLMGFTHDYALILLLAIIGGAFGSLFHPTANALVPAHYPKSPGMAIGLLGIGSGLGFWLGPKFSGWRAETAHWHLWHVAVWQKPLVELGVLGIVCGVLFLLFGSESGEPATDHPPLGRELTKRTLLIAATLGCRDFAGVSSISLVGIYLQKAHHMSVERTGTILGSMMLVSIIVNPLAVWISPGRRRLPLMVGLLLAGAFVLASVPWAPIGLTLGVLALFQGCQLGSYSVSDAAMLERVPGNMRGRVVGVFLSLAGTAAACGPWVMGWWTDSLGARASQPTAYGWVFAFTGGLMAVATLSAPLIARLGEVQGEPIEPFSEIMPGTVEVVG